MIYLNVVKIKHICLETSTGIIHFSICVEGRQVFGTASIAVDIKAVVLVSRLHDWRHYSHIGIAPEHVLK